MSFKLKDDEETVLRLSVEHTLSPDLVRAVLREVNEAINRGHPTSTQRKVWSHVEWTLWNRFQDDKARAQAEVEEQTPEARIARLEEQVARLLAHCGLENTA